MTVIYNSETGQAPTKISSKMKYLFIIALSLLTIAASAQKKKRDKKDLSLLTPPN